ncbi:hypothetical protein BDY21DRAFT_360997 [Lineolata rhizophorae]|uniref:DUF7905 domain-containing protein n=1 Tax=Lineolata rhizophorae TaxID=578093 RepID=A0A6A6PAK8_9PEZI|nr:hypothetical protein BDY21DRAFT_360997 [Lineolata rhizophorae]
MADFDIGDGKNRWVMEGVTCQYQTVREPNPAVKDDAAPVESSGSTLNSGLDGNAGSAANRLIDIDDNPMPAVAAGDIPKALRDMECLVLDQDATNIEPMLLSTPCTMPTEQPSLHDETSNRTLKFGNPTRCSNYFGVLEDEPDDSDRQSSRDLQPAAAAVQHSNPNNEMKKSTQQERALQSAFKAFVGSAKYGPAMSKMPNKSKDGFIGRPRVPVRGNVILNTRPDNEGEIAWRQRKNPALRVQLPPKFAMLARDLGTWNNIFKPQISEIGYQTSTSLQVLAQKGEGAQGRSLYCLIWGDLQKANDARQRLMSLIEDCGVKKFGKKEWAKVPSLSGEHLILVTSRLDNEEMYESYRRIPHPSYIPTVPPAMFHWPSEGFNSTSVLGSSLEALDPIRTRYRAFITYRGAAAVMIQTDAADNQTKVIECLNRVLEQYWAALVSSICLTLFKPYGRGEVKENVKLTEYRLQGAQNHKKPSQDTTAISGMLTEYTGSMAKAEDIDPTWPLDYVNIARLQIPLEETMTTMEKRRGVLQLRARFGTFLTTRYRKTNSFIYHREDFEKMLEQGGEGIVTETIGTADLEKNILDKILKAPEIVPEEASINDTVMVKPDIIVIFTIKAPRSTNDTRGDMRLEMGLSGGVSRDIGGATRRWSRFETDANESTTIMSCITADLKDSTGWDLKLTARAAVDDTRIPVYIKSWADRVKFRRDISDDISKHDEFVQWYATVPVTGYEQRRVWRFNITKSEYVLEISQVTKWRVKFNTDKVKYGTSERTRGETHWSVAVFNTNWDEMLASNSRLQVGEECPWNWERDQDKFFPYDNFAEGTRSNGGREALMDTLSRVEAIVKGTEAKLPERPAAAQAKEGEGLVRQQKGKGKKPWACGDEGNIMDDPFTDSDEEHRAHEMSRRREEMWRKKEEEAARNVPDDFW